MKKILFQGGHLINPATQQEKKMDLLVEEGIVSALFLPGKTPESLDCERISIPGLCIAPGFIDLHVHLRVPGDEHKETLETGARAAIKGGFTTVVCMPNTRPRLESPGILQDLLSRAQKAVSIKILPAGAMITSKDEIPSYCDLKEAGAVCLSDDAFPIQASPWMYQGMKKAVEENLSIFTHCEDITLSHRGIMHEGEISKKLGVPGIPPCAEEVHLARNLILARQTGARLHIQHLSTSLGLSLVQWARSEGVNVTCEVAPHHLLLNHEHLLSRDANFRMNPPLRPEEDRKALVQALLEGHINAIATDHAPHTPQEKENFLTAPFGVIGMETAFPLVWTLLKDKLPGWKILSLFTSGPAHVLGRKEGSLEPGSPADIVVFHPEEEWTLGSQDLGSKSQNCPFLGWKMKGKIRMVFCAGKKISEPL